uniref:Glutathione S-transferase isoform 2 n=1 Tax=Halisarca dujardinii TaxID=2583056 RepID=A0A6C0PNB6_HALDU|nr:glutathione S-transferase isoform 2 [Halisarca dujardinii]QIZ30875.1 glutathione S-transferase isoform 2 [Halisarca dujardinii]
MSLKLYADFLSQPCRAVGLLLEKEAVPYDMVTVSLIKGENKTNEEFGRVAPLKQVPAIDDKGFTLFESAAILKYLVRAYNLPSHWYPEDVQKRARVDQYLVWQQGNIRNGLFFKKCAAPVFGLPVDQAEVDKLEGGLKAGMQFFQDYFLAGDGPFVCGSEISIADLQAMCQISQFWIAGLKAEAFFPKIEAWMKACQNFLGKSFEKVYKTVYDLAEEGKMKGASDFKWK